MELRADTTDFNYMRRSTCKLCNVTMIKIGGGHHDIIDIFEKVSDY